MVKDDNQTPLGRAPRSRNAKSLSPTSVLDRNKISKATRIPSKFRQRLDRYKYSYLNALEFTSNGFDDSTVQDSPLLRLPAEIKIKIFELIWSRDSYVNLRASYRALPPWRNRTGTALLRTCRRLNIEARPAFHKHTRFSFTGQKDQATEEVIKGLLRKPLALQRVCLDTREYRVIEHLVDMLPDLRFLKVDISEGFCSNEQRISLDDFKSSQARRDELYVDMHAFHGKCETLRYHDNPFILHLVRQCRCLLGDLDLAVRIRPKVLLEGRLQQGWDWETRRYLDATCIYSSPVSTYTTLQFCAAVPANISS